jgi:hypothetical protein
MKFYARKGEYMLEPEIHCSRGAPAGSHSSGRFRIRQPPASGYEAKPSRLDLQNYQVISLLNIFSFNQIQTEKPQ